MAVIDIRGKTPRSNATRNESAIKNIARHHSATPTGDWNSFWSYWHGTKKWGTGGYHEIILRNGDVELCYDPNEITNGIANHNTSTYHICVVGNGSFTEAQEKTFDERCKLAMKRFNLPVTAVLGHNEFKGTATSCPGIDMNMVRKRLESSTMVVSGYSSPTLKSETETSLSSKARREIIVNAAVKSGAHKSWLDKLSTGAITDDDLKGLAVKYLIDTNK